MPCYYCQKQAHIFLFDTGSNAHVTNDVECFEPGSVRDCDVRVCGISANKQNTSMNASLCGDVKYVVSAGLTVVLRNVLYLPGAALGMSGLPEPASTVLVGGSRFKTLSHYSCLGATIVTSKFQLFEGIAS